MIAGAALIAYVAGAKFKDSIENLANVLKK